ncbi:hypothetical protein PFMALIP_00965 [Plasmodium falciparum MaliPS096_E11]|uniref:Uncharacterized protein n=1 Tax=Plasmodium falciparum MaliPS096_E11 TaxID=1036727 RepID=A0A024WV03_PLAFA|nr:hypothetical protein PFMALIP_00965 [Plasmodium falciparum MaliPS096_E11]
MERKQNLQKNVKMERKQNLQKSVTMERKEKHVNNINNADNNNNNNNNIDHKSYEDILTCTIERDYVDNMKESPISHMKDDHVKKNKNNHIRDTDMKSTQSFNYLSNNFHNIYKFPYFGWVSFFFVVNLF